QSLSLIMALLKALAIAGFTLLVAAAAQAHKVTANQSDEVMARVNYGTIMRSVYERALEDLLKELQAQGLEGQALEKKLNESKQILLRDLIDQELLVQRAKDL